MDSGEKNSLFSFIMSFLARRGLARRAASADVASSAKSTGITPLMNSSSKKIESRDSDCRLTVGILSLIQKAILATRV